MMQKISRLQNRRAIVLGGAALIGAIAGSAAADDTADARFASELRRLEAGIGCRLGVGVRDTQTGRRYAYRGAELFPLCSTFKLLASAAVLTRVDAGREDLDRRIVFGAGDIVANSPVTENRVGGAGMALAEICEAAITRSDNTAGNLILATLGGPSGVTAFARTLGDAVTRLDRTETALNEAAPGDPRDTTTPEAMAANLDTLVLGSALSARSREQLITWLIANQTGGTRLRAGLPRNWRIGDKTGAGERGTTNDVAVVWPLGRKPLIVCAYLTDTSTPTEQCNATIAAVARAVETILVS